MRYRLVVVNSNIINKLYYTLKVGSSRIYDELCVITITFGFEFSIFSHIQNLLYGRLLKHSLQVSARVCLYIYIYIYNELKPV